MIALGSDFDQTIYFKREIPRFHEADLAAIKKFQALGYKFGLCTGRPVYSALACINVDLTFDFYICSSGACILDADKQVVFEKRIDHKIVMDILACTGECFQYVHLNKRFYIYKKDQRLAPDVGPDTPLISDDGQILNGVVHSLSLRNKSREDAIKQSAMLNKRFGDIIVAINNGTMVDVSPLGVTKMTGMLFAKEYFKFDKLYGIGDGTNDIPMFRGSDEAFALDFALDNVKNEADHVVSGIDKAIEQIIQ